MPEGSASKDLYLSRYYERTIERGGTGYGREANTWVMVSTLLKGLWRLVYVTGWQKRFSTAVLGFAFVRALSDR